MNWMFAGVASGTAICSATVYFALRLKAYWAPSARPAAELADFSMARYEPMTRLLSNDDLEFLKAQRGYRPEIGEKLQRDRRRLFRSYLSDLSRDFRSLHAAAREMVAHSEAENADLVGALLRQQVTFWTALVAIELRLTTGDLGFSSALQNVDVRGLIQAIETMRLEMSRLAAVPTVA